MSQSLKVKDKNFIYLISLAITTGGFNLGYTAVSLSFLQKHINRQNNTDSNFYLSIATTALPIGALIGSLIYQKFIDRFGDRKLMIALDIIGILAYFMQIFSLNIWPLLIARLVIGIVIGSNLGVIPSYIVSIAPQQMSGFLNFLLQIVTTLGVLVCYIVALTLRQAQQATSFDRLIFFIVPILACCWRTFTLLYQFPFDNIQTLLKDKQTSQVMKYLQLFYQNPSLSQFKAYKLEQYRKSRLSNVKSEYQLIDSGQASLSNLNRRIKLVFVIIVANQFCGINTIFYYTKQIFDKVAKGDQIVSGRLSLTLGATQVAATLMSGLIVDRFGERKMMLIGSTVVCLSLFAAFVSDSAQIQSLLVAGIFCHIIGFAFSLGPITLAYAAKILQDLTSSLTLLWCQTIFISLVSAQLIQGIGIGNLFMCYALITGLCMFYVFKNMKQVKGLTKAQMVSQFKTDQDQKNEKNYKKKIYTAPNKLTSQFLQVQPIQLSSMK